MENKIFENETEFDGTVNETPIPSDSIESNEADMSSYNNISRYKQREQTFLIVFESLFSDTDVDEIADNFTDSTAAFYSQNAINTAKLIQEMSETLDAEISKYLTKNWRIQRISKISHAVLRVAVYEMLYCENIPVSVSINEAVELTKKYSVTEDASFVNGVLGSLAKVIE